jgi:hypothetical protein
MMEALSKKHRSFSSWNCNAKVLFTIKLQKIWDSKQMPATEVFCYENSLTAAFQIIEQN